MTNPETPATNTQLEKAERVPVSLGIVVDTIDEAWRLAKNFADSDLVPKDYRGKAANVFVAIQLGAELGLAPMQAVQSIAVVNGRPALYGDGLLAVIQASPLYVSHEEYYVVRATLDPDGTVRGGTRVDGLEAADLERLDTAAVCAFTRKGQAEPTIRAFSIAQAKRAGLWRKDGPWTLYPDRMLRMRARSWAARDTFADLLRGLKAAEEAMDDPPDKPHVTRVARLSDPPAHSLGDFVDRTAATRHDDEPAILGAGLGDAPTSPAVDVGPSTILTLDEHREHPEGDVYWTLTLDTGEIIDTDRADHADALRPYAGTARRFKFSCRRDILSHDRDAPVTYLDLLGWAILPDSTPGFGAPHDAP